MKRCREWDTKTEKAKVDVVKKKAESKGQRESN